MLNPESHHVNTTAELLAATADPNIRDILIGAHLNDVPTLRLSPGQTLTGAAVGAAQHPTVRFAAGKDGLQISANNRVEKLELVVDLDKRALFNDTSVEQLGRFVLQTLTITGLVQLLARDGVRGGTLRRTTLTSRRRTLAATLSVPAATESKSFPALSRYGTSRRMCQSRSRRI